MRWARHEARMDGGRDVDRVCVGNPEGMSPFRRNTCQGDYNTKMHLQEVGRGSGSG